LTVGREPLRLLFPCKKGPHFRYRCSNATEDLLVGFSWGEFSRELGDEAREKELVALGDRPGRVEEAEVLIVVVFVVVVVVGADVDAEPFALAAAALAPTWEEEVEGGGGGMCVKSNIGEWPAEPGWMEGERDIGEAV